MITDRFRLHGTKKISGDYQSEAFSNPNQLIGIVLANAKPFNEREADILVNTCNESDK